MTQGKDTFALMLANRFAAYRNDAYDNLEQIHTWAEPQANGVVSVALGSACRAQNFHVITEGRNALKRMPREWLIRCLPNRISEALDLQDDWEFRRLLEILEEISEKLLREYIKRGLLSNNPEVREAAEEYSGFA